jgi:FkbM family methyltransferase
MKPFTENDRYEYPLTPDSLALDCGVHQGQFAHTLHDKYGCRIVGFEPVTEFYDKSVDRLKALPKITIRHAGVGATTRQERMSIKGDMSGIFADNPTAEDVQILAIGDILAPWDTVDLIKLNIEGMEFEVLEAVLAEGWATKLRNIQVQFHSVVPEFERRHADIRGGLLKTHHLTFDAPWCWENYALD